MTGVITATLGAMSTPFATFFLVLFVAHLAGFSWLGLKRRQWYYLALVVTFALLSAAFGVLLLAPEWRAGGQPVHLWLRFAAWGAAAVSISWTIARRVADKRRRD